MKETSPPPDFVSACTRILGLEGTPEGVEDNGMVTRVAAFPIGIDPERFTQALQVGQPPCPSHMQLPDGSFDLTGRAVAVRWA